MSDSVHVLSQHPLVGALLSKLRLTSTSAKEFRAGIHDISLMLGYEASRGLEQATFEGTSPVSTFTGTVVKPRVGFTPILRAGLGMVDALLTLFPDAPVYHLGLYRDKLSLQPVEYYSKLPASPPVDVCYLLDPLIATGGTSCAALHMIQDWGIPMSQVKIICVLASQDGLKNVLKQFPGIEIWVAGVDDELTEEGLILPGLGDTGDRLNNTARDV
ncbi:UDP-N-acetylglucosamine 1-carboxyvinyltransferase [Amylostereum chailletii]|nr:UDP-N-acetylglucosamine 1-carboxyvinyltransferase [Amylostereum chailletii]